MKIFAVSATMISKGQIADHRNADTQAKRTYFVPWIRAGGDETRSHLIPFSANATNKKMLAIGSQTSENYNVIDMT